MRRLWNPIATTWMPWQQKKHIKSCVPPADAVAKNTKNQELTAKDQNATGVQKPTVTAQPPISGEQESTSVERSKKRWPTSLRRLVNGKQDTSQPVQTEVQIFLLGCLARNSRVRDLTIHINLIRSALPIFRRSAI